MIKKLYPKDCVAVVSPSSSFDKKKFEKGIEIIKNYKLKPIYDQNIIADSYQYLNGDDSFRSQNLEKYILDPKIKAIFMARGGYGAIRTIENIKNKDIFIKNKKLIIGFSDITVFHIFLNSNKIESIHGPMVSSFIRDEETTNKLFNILMGDQKLLSYKLKTLTTDKDIEGDLIGGNLTVLISLIGTPYFPNLKNKILFLEDINEPIYKIDRMVFQMKLLNNLPKAIILGQFTNCGNYSDIEKIFIGNLKNINIYSNLDVGHDFKTETLPLGVYGKIKKSKLEINWR